MADACTAKIYQLYADYIRWSGEFLADYGGIKIFSQMFTGGADYKKREEHARFITSCEAAATEYLAALSSGEAERDALMPLLRYVLLDCHGEGDDWAEWMLLAAERCFIPFLRLLKSEEMTQLYEPYRRLRKKNRGLPPQDEILKILKKRRAG